MTPDEIQLRKEIREEILQSLSPEQLDGVKLTKEETKKIELSYNFLIGTENYQLIYKLLSGGSKSRGTMKDIINDCIAWLYKHQIYLALYK